MFRVLALAVWSKREAKSAWKEVSFVLEIRHVFREGLEQLAEDHASGPNVYGASVVFLKENDFRRPIKTCLDVTREASSMFTAYLSSLGKNF